MTSRLLFRAVLIAACAGWIGGCGGGGDAPPPPPPMIGAAGGTVSGPNGAQVVVPAGALSAPVAITITLTAARPLPAGLQTLGTVYDLGPAGTTFAVPVTVTLPLDPAQVPAGARVRMLHELHVAGTDTWEELSGLVVGATSASAQTMSFSHFTLVVGNLPPQITSQPASVSVVEPTTASFSVTALGTPPFTYQWHKSDDGGLNFGAIGGANTATYTTPATTVAADNGDLYRVIVSNLEGAAQSVDVTLTVTTNVIAPTITTPPHNASVAVGANATFTVMATGTGLVYQWHKDGAPIAGQTNASLNLVNVQAGDAGSYTVVVSNLVNGSAINGVTSNAATLTVTTTGLAASKIAAATQHSLALARNGTVYSWGLNTLNELGRNAGTTFDAQAAAIPALTNVAVDIATAGSTSLALLADGTVRSWGSNGRGLLGIGTTAVTAGVQTVSGLNAVTRIAMGYGHALALRSDGTVWAWGGNVSGAIGDGTKIDRSVPVQVSGLSNVIEIAIGGANSFALRSDGTVWAWGEGDLGNSPLLLGQGNSDFSDRLVPIQVQVVTGAVALEASFHNAFARTASGQMWAWGQGVPGVFDPATSTPLPQLLGNLPVAAAYTTGTCFVTTRVDPFNYLLIAQANGVLSAFGDAGAPVGGLAASSNVTDVSAVDCHALAARSDGTVWGAGLNNAGQLGDGTTTTRNLPVQVIGLNLN